MRPWLLVFVIIFLTSVTGCARPAQGESDQVEVKNSKASKPTPLPAQAQAPASFSREIPATFPVYTAEVEKQIKSLKPGQWIPIAIDREYLILRGSGIRLERGPYFVQTLSDSTGSVTKFLIAKNRDIKLQDVNLAKAAASDGSFAEVLNFDGTAQMIAKYKDTRAYVISSGESGSIWVHIASSDLEWRGEVMGLASPSKAPITAQ
jgi:hypothetical protein